ncbi:hypothetical protein U1701_13270 [Sphingomonas sp. PB2P19]|uniref:hypothetical protein n=1 Tax=Sphingomonas rhamnosi TaxID=3096156 RepID=UPI002FC83908
MSRADFTLTYDGPALQNHEMDVRELAPAMLGVGELFDAMNLLLNGETAEVKVNVRAHEPGCFSVVFDIVQGWKDGAIALLSGDLVTSAINLKELLLGGAGLIWWIRKHRGKTPDKVERLSGNMIRVTYGDESFDVPLELLRLYQDLAVRSALEKVVHKPLQAPGITLVEFGARSLPDQRVTDDDAEAFRTPEIPERILVKDVREAAFSIVSLAFKEDNKWRLHDGSNAVSAVIRDEEFLARVDRNQIRFAKGDVLICEVEFTQKQTAKGLVTENIVTKVKQHIAAPRQLSLLPDRYLDDHNLP